MIMKVIARAFCFHFGYLDDAKTPIMLFVYTLVILLLSGIANFLVFAPTHPPPIKISVFWCL